MKKLILLTINFLLFYLPLFSQQENSLNFDGGNDYINIPDASFSNSSDYTIEGWFKSSSLLQTLFDGIKTGTTFSYLHIEIQTNGTLRFLHRAPAGISGGTDIYSTSVVNDGNWQHFAAVKGNDNKTRLYVNGLLEATSTSTVTNITENISINLGRNHNDARYLEGNLDEFRFWSTARTATEIQNSMNVELTGSESNLVNYYPFNQGVPDGDNGSGCPSGVPCVIELEDISNGNTGSLNNFSLNGIMSNWTNITFLPVELIYFRGQKIAGNIVLQWTTASEINNAGFEIQKSRDARDWQIIEFIEGQGTTDEINDYQYLDKNSFSGINYYRLKQIDYDGAFEYSKVIAVQYDNSENTLQVFPNPSNRLISVQINNSSNQKMKVKITDNLGRIIWESGLIKDESNWRKEMEIEKNGIYFVTAQVGGEAHYQRIIILDEN